MASGHGTARKRPNTWLLRPTCKVKILLANPEPSTHGPLQDVQFTLPDLTVQAA
jgi:hypothetical protein